MFSTFGAQRNTARTEGRTLALKRCKMALKRRKIVQKAGDNRNMLFCKVLPNWQRIVHSTFLWFYTGCDRYNSSCKPHKWWFLANRNFPFGDGLYMFIGPIFVSWWLMANIGVNPTSTTKAGCTNRGNQCVARQMEPASDEATGQESTLVGCGWSNTSMSSFLHERSRYILVN